MNTSRKSPKHVVPYGTPGTGKSHFASTMPTPQYVIMFDPIGKESPYTNGTFLETFEDLPEEEQPTFIYKFNQLVTIPTWDCYEDKEGTKLIRRIIWFPDPDNEHPTAYDTYAALQPQLKRFLDAKGFQTLILDSVTLLRLALRNKFYVDPHSGERTKTEDSARGWAGRATDEIEWVMQWINSLTINTCMICHSNYSYDATTVGRNQDYPHFGIEVPGRLRVSMLATAGEVYLCTYKDGNYFVTVTAGNDHAGNNSMQLTGTFPNNWNEIIKHDKTNVQFISRPRQSQKEEQAHGAIVE